MVQLISNNPYCNFCGKANDEVSQLLQGESPQIHICDKCVGLSHDILEKKRRRHSRTKIINNIKRNIGGISPPKIHEHLNKYIIGQDHVKKGVSVAVYNHYKRVLLNDGDVDIQKSNLLLLGPTGVGKTLIAQTLSKVLEVPFVITDATTITESGYAGDDAEVLIQRLVQAADYNIEKAQIGIIYVDEIDKKAKRNDMVSLSRDVSGEGVQQSLLKLMEGTVVKVPNKPQANPETIEINTKDILFIVSGAFVGLDNQVMQRLGKSKIGFTDKLLSEHQWEEHLETRDLVQYGLIPEFVGRIPCVSVLRELTEDDLVKVLTEPKNSLVEQYKALFALDKFNLEFTIESVKAVANIAINQGLGARGLRKILDDALMDTQYNLPDNHARGFTSVLITDEVINKGKKPHMQKGSNIE